MSTQMEEGQEEEEKEEELQHAVESMIFYNKNDFSFLSDTWFAGDVDVDVDDNQTGSLFLGNILFLNSSNNKTDTIIIRQENQLKCDIMSLIQPPLLAPYHNFTSSPSPSHHHHHREIQESLQRRIDVIHKWMGSMALCRGRNGDALRQAGAIEHIFILLHNDVIPYFLFLWSLTQEGDYHHGVNLETAFVLPLIYDLIICSLSALRDLACGNSFNRQAMGDSLSLFHNNYQHIFKNNHRTFHNGIEMITFFIQRKHLMPWKDIIVLVTTNNTCSTSSIGNMELKLFTTACGVIRNTTHSNRRNCDLVQELGLSQLFIWRLLYGDDDDDDNDGSRYLNNTDTTNLPHQEYIASQHSNQTTTPNKLPDPSIPWREACFRMTTSLLNIAEYNVECSILCASNNRLIELFLTTWDDHLFEDNGDESKVQKKIQKKGRSIPLLHPGLANILTQYSLLYKNKRKNMNECKDEEETTEEDSSKLSIIVQKILIREEKRKIAARIRQQKSQTI